MSRNMQKGKSYKIPDLWRVTEVDCKCWWRCLKLSYILFSRHTCFYDFKALAWCGAHWSKTVDHLFFGAHHSVISYLWKQFQITKTVVWRPLAGRPRVTRNAEDLYIAILDKRNRRETFTCVTLMVTATTGKAISAATVRRILHMSGLYARVPRVSLFLSVQSKGEQLKWCREHFNWIESDLENVLFNDLLWSQMKSV